MPRVFRAAKAIGFAGKVCLGPMQAAVANIVFQPSVEELQWAQAVQRVTSNELGKGTLRLCDQSSRIFVGPPHKRTHHNWLLIEKTVAPLVHTLGCVCIWRSYGSKRDEAACCCS